MDKNPQITILSPTGKLLVGNQLFEDEDESQEQIKLPQPEVQTRNNVAVQVYF